MKKKRVELTVRADALIAPNESTGTSERRCRGVTGHYVFQIGPRADAVKLSTFHQNAPVSL
jgi:hypothetical protein